MNYFQQRDKAVIKQRLLNEEVELLHSITEIQGCHRLDISIGGSKKVASFLNSDEIVRVKKIVLEILAERLEKLS